MKDNDAIAREIHTRHHIFVNDTFDRKEISEIVAILRKHDEAEASGESDLAKCTIQLLLPTDADPFRRESCNIIDHSYSENGITIECPALMLERHERERKELEA